MRPRRATRRGETTLSLLLVTLTGIVLVASGCFGGGGSKERKAALTGTSTTETGPSRGSGELECASNDLVFLEHVDRAEPKQGQEIPETPQAAVAAEIAHLNPHLTPGMFQREAAPSGDTSERVTFAHERAGQKVAQVTVGRYGTGWGIREIRACNSLLTGSSP